MSVDISKLNGYTVLSPDDLAMSKLQGYAVLSAILPGVSASKCIGYTVVADAPATSSARGQILCAAL